MARDWPHPLDPEPTVVQARWRRIEAWIVAAVMIAALIVATSTDAKRKRGLKRATPATVRSLASSSGGFRNCTEARAAGAAPVRRGSPGYSRRLDRDGDGVGCE